MNSYRTKVLVVDDSAVVRGLLIKALEKDPEILIAGTAMHGEAALGFLEKEPVDVVILDLEMPVMDGLTTLEIIQKEFPETKVIILSGLTKKGAEVTIRALARGAISCIPKPDSVRLTKGLDEISQELLPLLKALGKTPVENPKVPVKKANPLSHQLFIKVIVIGSSTGGPQALSTLLSGLPEDFTVPILIAQHMPPLFTAELAKQIERDAKRPCREAKHQEIIERNHIYVAPGDHHLLVDKHDQHMVTILNKAPAEHFCRPSVNPLFRSVAEWYGRSALGVMLTGMGSDGIEGSRELIKKGGYLIAQDKETSVVWGMPAAVVEENLAHQELPLPQIANAIVNLQMQKAVRS